MQQLSEELKNTPGDTSPVPCSVSTALTREETLSVSSIVLTDNNSEENLLQVTGGLKTDMLPDGGDKCPPLQLYRRCTIPPLTS